MHHIDVKRAIKQTPSIIKTGIGCNHAQLTLENISHKKTNCLLGDVKLHWVFEEKWGMQANSQSRNTCQWWSVSQRTQNISGSA